MMENEIKKIIDEFAKKNNLMGVIVFDHKDNTLIESSIPVSEKDLDQLDHLRSFIEDAAEYVESKVEYAIFLGRCGGAVMDPRRKWTIVALFPMKNLTTMKELVEELAEQLKDKIVYPIEGEKYGLEHSLDESDEDEEEYIEDWGESKKEVWRIVYETISKNMKVLSMIVFERRGKPLVNMLPYDVDPDSEASGWFGALQLTIDKTFLRDFIGKVETTILLTKGITIVQYAGRTWIVMILFKEGVKLEEVFYETREIVDKLKPVLDRPQY